jgi:hypothetical protein
VAERRAPVDCAPPVTADPSHPELTLPQFHRVRRQLEIIIGAAKRLSAA